ncbi:MAG: DUF362 domain-containing protein [Candidatus Hydrothermarchaeaceae archaeon]
MDFKLEVKEEECTGCGNCAVVCPINAMVVTEVLGGKGGGVELRIENGISKVTLEECNGCGVCVSMCPNRAISLNVREQPVSSKEMLIDAIGSEDDGPEVPEEAEALPSILFRIDKKKRKIIERALEALKNVKVRYLIEKGEEEKAREDILKRGDKGD